MMKEILRTGALNTEFQAPNVFATYKQGIINASGFEDLRKSVTAAQGEKADNLTDSTLNDQGKAWANLNHSVVIIGWGVDDADKKYWIVRNSYGSGWGQNGDFLIRRGQDDLGIESEQVSYEVESLI